MKRIRNLRNLIVFVSAAFLLILVFTEVALAGLIKPECSDKIDNDGDGYCDFRGCNTIVDGIRTNLPPDPDCTSPSDDNESFECIPTTEVCDGVDNDCDDQIDEDLSQQCGVSDVGECQFGTQTCSDGVWGSCQGNVDPIPEICDGLDNDCDGFVDIRQCGVSDVGECQFGTQTCSNDTWGDCQGNIDPVNETCDDGLDNDCDGSVDEGCPGVTEGIAVYMGNPMYWEYDGQPILLVGGSDLDNLFQWDETVYPWPDGTTLVSHLDLLQSVGGNYIRNTMSSRSYDPNDDLYPLRWNELPYPYLEVGDGIYDLDQWNPEYWQKIETLLSEAQARGIIVQIEIWDRDNEAGSSRDSGTGWYWSPWNPDNNINYDWKDSGLLRRGPTGFPNRWHYAALYNDPVLLPVQQNFVNKIVDTVIDGGHNNVLFQMANEASIPREDLEPDPYWAQYIRDYATSKGREAYVSCSRYFHGSAYPATTFQDFNNPEIYNVILNPSFNFNDIASNNGNSGQYQYDNIVWYRGKMIENDKLRPINNVKSYYFNWGTEETFDQRTEGNDVEASSRMWRGVFGGAASFRFHRNSPTIGTISQNGLGLSPLGQIHIKSMSMFEESVNLFSMVPNNTLLSQRSDDEAYCLVEEGSQVAVFFTGHDDHSVQLDVSSMSSSVFNFSWLDINNTAWNPKMTTHNGDIITLTAPDSGQWVAVLEVN